MKTIWVCMLAVCLSSCVVYYQKESVNTDNMARHEIGQALAEQFPDIDEQELHDIVKSKIKSKYYSSKEFKQAAMDSGMVCNDKSKNAPFNAVLWKKWCMLRLIGQKLKIKQYDTIILFLWIIQVAMR